MSFEQQTIAHMRADKSGGAGNHNSQADLLEGGRPKPFPILPENGTVRCGAATPGCSRLSGGLFADERSIGFATTRSISVAGRGAASKGGCSQDWLPHIAIMHPSSAEIVVFAALFSASLYAFWRRFGPVADIIRRSKPDADFKLQPVAPRVRKFVWEVLLQGKVIRERPLPGIAHAFVFWGFCAFALITISHFAAGVGLNLLPSDCAIVRGYRYFVAVFAMAVALSIAGLAFRRLVLRPVWLDPKSRSNPDSSRC